MAEGAAPFCKWPLDVAHVAGGGEAPGRAGDKGSRHHRARHSGLAIADTSIL